MVLLAEARLGEIFNRMPKQAGGDRRSENFKLPDAGKFENEEAEMEKPKPKLEVAADMGFNKNQVALAKIELGKRFNELPKNRVGRPKEIIDTPVD